MNLNGNLSITYTGHSTVLIELDGVRLLTDPLLRKRVAHLGRLVDVPDPADQPIETMRRIRDDIEARVTALIAEIGAD